MAKYYFRWSRHLRNITNLKKKNFSHHYIHASNNKIWIHTFIKEHTYSNPTKLRYFLTLTVQFTNTWKIEKWVWDSREDWAVSIFIHQFEHKWFQKTSERYENVTIRMWQMWTIQCSDSKTNSSLQHVHLTKLGFCYCPVCLSRWLWAYLQFIPVASTFVQGKKQDDLLLNFGVLAHFSEY